MKIGGDLMSEGTISIKKAIPIIVVTWILSLVTALAIAYFTPFTPVGTSKIDEGAVTAGKIVDDAIITTKLANGSVTSAKILDATITAEDVANGSIVAIKVADGAITTAKIVDGSITTTKIADSAVVTVNLADDSVTTSKISDGAIVTVKLADGSVTSAKILDATITATDLASGAVTSTKIADGAVTTSKIADGSVTDVKLATGAIPMWSNFSAGSFSFTSSSWINDTGITANITLNRTSDLLIVYSAEAWMSAAGDYIIIRTRVNATDALPGATDNPVLLSSANQPGEPNGACATRVFYLANVTAGTYVVQVQYYMWSGVATGTVRIRTLNIIAFPK